MERVRRCHVASFESHMVVNTPTVEKSFFINLFIILIYITERLQMSILINFRILQHKSYDANQEYFLPPYCTVLPLHCTLFLTSPLPRMSACFRVVGAKYRKKYVEKRARIRRAWICTSIKIEYIGASESVVHSARTSEPTPEN